MQNNLTDQDHLRLFGHCLESIMFLTSEEVLGLVEDDISDTGKDIFLGDFYLSSRFRSGTNSK